MTLMRNRGFRASAMSERIDVQSPTTDYDTGEPVRSWNTLYSSEPAAYQPFAGTETIKGRQVEAGVSAVFTVHERVGYTPECRIAWNNQIWGITYVKELEGGPRYLELHCRKIPNG